MKPLFRQLAIAGACLLAAGSALAGVTVTVNYFQPEKFADMPFEPWEREDVLKGLTQHFESLGKKLPPGQTLKIEVLDIDLAGRLVPGAHGGHDIRILRGGADWPRIQLRYSLEENGRVLASGDAKLADMNYLGHLNRYPDGDRLRFEKQMIDDWFDKTIVHKQ